MGSPLAFSNNREVKTHLCAAHRDDLGQLSDAALEQLNLYLCRECENAVFVSLTELTTHVRRNHLQSRSDTNLQLVEKILFEQLGDGFVSHWEDGLAFLQHLDLSPPTFRQSLINKISHRLESSVCNTFLSVIELAAQASFTPTHSRHLNHHEFDRWTIEKLAVIFEQIVLFPLPTTENRDLTTKKQSVNQTIHERLRRFKQGRIRELYEESRLVRSKSPKELSLNPPSIQKSAQLAADLDNYKSANARITKHAPVALINDSNLQVLEKLHPPSLRRGCIKPRRNTRAGSTKRKLKFTPEKIIDVLTHLHRAKAPGLQVDSLDIYIKCAKSIKLSTQRGKDQATNLATFFSTIANGDVSTGMGKFLRQTYQVALEKDPEDKTKLRPLGVPSAIRRIAAIAILSEYSATFAEHLLPFNFAVGVGGGCDVVAKTIQLGVDKYITTPINKNGIPTRALVSLDIRNMFNAISREKLREIIAEEFNTLEGFADLLYEEAGETFVKLENGTWKIISVEEGFSQGCPCSPLFAALVLNIILRRLQRELDTKSQARQLIGDKGDDGKGTVTLTAAYVDDCNSLIHLGDVEFFLNRFRELAEPLGAVLNTEKTRILTSTDGTTTTSKLLSDDNPVNVSIGQSLQRAISNYSTTIKDGTRLPVEVEVVDGLRVLGVPVGSPAFCKNFMLKCIKKAMKDSQALLAGLDDLQTILRLFSTCTVHKMTHLFSSDVSAADPNDLPQNFYLWGSPMTDQFSEMTNSMLAAITESDDIPSYSQIIANLSLKQGGLGFQHPRANAISAFMTSTKRCLQYSHQGVWLGHNRPRPPLPHSFTTLFNDWENSDQHHC